MKKPLLLILLFLGHYANAQIPPAANVTRFVSTAPNGPDQYAQTLKSLWVAGKLYIPYYKVAYGQVLTIDSAGYIIPMPDTFYATRQFARDNGVAPADRTNWNQAYNKSPVYLSSPAPKTIQQTLRDGTILSTVLQLPANTDSAKTDSAITSIKNRQDTLAYNLVTNFYQDQGTGEIILTTGDASQIVPAPATLQPLAANLSTTPSATTYQYFPLDVGTYANFTTNGTTNLTTTTTDYEAQVPVFVRNGLYWAKSYIKFPASNLPQKDSMLRMTSKMSTYPFSYNAPILTDRNVRSGIISIEIDHPDYLNKRLFLRGFGKDYNDGSGTNKNYFIIGDEVGPGTTWAGGVTNTGIWNYNAVTDTGVQTIKVIKQGSDRIGWAKINWDSVANGYRHGLAASAALRAPLHELVTLTRDMSFAYNPPQPIQLPYTRDTLMLPSELFFVEDNPLSVYWDNCLTNDSIANKSNKRMGCVIISRTMMNPIHIVDDRQIILDPKTFKDGDTAFFYVHYQITPDVNTKKEFYKMVTLRKVTAAEIAASPDTIIHFGFGNSILDFDMTDTVYNRLVGKYLGKVIWAGTKKNGPGTSTLTRDDGRASAEAATYIGAQTYYTSSIKWPIDSTRAPWDSTVALVNFCNPLIRPVRFGTDFDTSDWYRYTPSLGGDGKDRERTYRQDVLDNRVQSFLDSGGKYAHMAIYPYIKQTLRDTNIATYRNSKKVWMWAMGYNDNNHNDNTDTSYRIAIRAFRTAVRKVHEFDSTIYFAVGTYLTVNRTINNDKPYTDYVQEVISITDSLKGLGWRVMTIPSWFEVDRTIPYDWANYVKQSVLVDTVGSNTITLTATNAAVAVGKFARGPGIRASGSKILAKVGNVLTLANPLVSNTPASSVITFSDGEDLIPGINNVQMSYGGDSIHPIAMPGIQMIANTLYTIPAYIIGKLPK